jgi:hypothetical protein
MANTIDWGQGSKENTIDWGQGATDNTINWGKSQTLSPGGETNITGASDYTNTKSINLDGVDDYVSCGDADNLSFGDGSSDSPFSISAWIKPDVTARFRIIFKYGSTLKEYFMQVAGGSKLQVSFKDSINNASIGRNGFTSITTASWSHVVMTYNGSGSATRIKVYLNGVLDNGSTTGTGSYTAMSNTSEPLEIGRFSASYADGHIDEVAVFNTELSASDITTIYNSGVPNDLTGTSGLVSWWRMGDGDTAPTLLDNGTGGNNGTMNNFSTFSTNVPT